MASEDKSHPSMVGGHAKYIQGAVASALGYDSGEQTKQEAINQMRRASESAPSGGQPVQSSVLGTVEQKLGELTGCEGLEKDGAQRIPAGSEETSGTG